MQIKKLTAYIYIYYPTKYDYFANEVSARSLYNLACWYSLAKDYYENSDDAIKWSGICLAYALARDRFNSNKQSGYGDLWRHVDNDPDLEDIRCHLPPLDLLKFKLSIEISKNPAITENPVLFKQKMNGVFKESNWNFAITASPPKFENAYDFFSK